MMNIGAISDREIGAMLYRLQFPNRDFARLEASVQEAFIRDAGRLREMLAQICSK